MPDACMGFDAAECGALSTLSLSSSNGKGTHQVLEALFNLVFLCGDECTRRRINGVHLERIEERVRHLAVHLAGDVLHDDVVFVVHFSMLRFFSICCLVPNI